MRTLRVSLRMSARPFPPCLAEEGPVRMCGICCWPFNGMIMDGQEERQVYVSPHTEVIVVETAGEVMCASEGLVDNEIT